MSLILPRVHVLLDGGTPRALASRADLVTSTELKRLVAYDARVTLKLGQVIERCLPLGDRWAVCRRTGSRVVWRILDQSQLDQIGHPAWLWTEPEWFDASNSERLEGPIPQVRPLRDLVRHMASLGGSRKHTISALSGALAGLRRRKRPVAVVVPPAAMRSSGAPARWFTIALLSCMPARIRHGVRVCIGHAPNSRRIDLVVCTKAPRGYRIIDATKPPDDGRDLVAYYVRNRLLANDAEAVETAASRFDNPVDDDGWGEGIRKLIRGGVPGVSQINEDMLERNPTGAMKAVRARLRAGAPLDAEVVSSLVTITAETSDHRPWRPLVIRPAVERARAVGSLLERIDEVKPKRELVEVLGAIQPRGAALQVWCEVLTRWMRDPQITDTALDILRETLLDSASPKSDREARGGLWCDAIRALCELRRWPLAQTHLHGDVARAMAASGQASSLVEAWSVIPTAKRTSENLDALCEVLDSATDHAESIDQLIRVSQDDPEALRRVLARWPNHEQPTPSRRPAKPDVGEGQGPLAAWVASGMEHAQPDQLAKMACVLAPGPLDAIWVEIERVLSRSATTPRDRFIALMALKPGLSALEHTAQRLIVPVIENTTFPDPDIAQVAICLLDLPKRSEIWPLVAITASAPGVFDDEVLDATVIAFMEETPGRGTAYEVATKSVHALGKARAWDPWQHARWLVRLALAPDRGQGLNETLAVGLLRALAQRPDAVERVATITQAFMAEHPDADGVRTYVDRVLPALWPRGLPKQLVQAINPRQFGPLPPIWARALGA